jgi:RNA polymerase sigma-70 factor (ECF subfamily)
VVESPRFANSSDADLVRAVQAGDLDAFGELFRRHYDDVRRACARRLRSRADADEVAQAAFVRAFERIHRCDGERRFGPWVHVIAQRLCLDLLRARSRVHLTAVPLPGRPDDAPAGPEEEVLGRERAEHVRRALRRLSPRQRTAVVARDVEDRRPPEIAAAFGMSLSAADSLLLRARRRLAVAYRLEAGEHRTAGA